MSFPLTILEPYFYPQAMLSSASVSSTQVETRQVRPSLSITAMNISLSVVRTKHRVRTDVSRNSGYLYITFLSIFRLHLHANLGDGMQILTDYRKETSALRGGVQSES